MKIQVVENVSGVHEQIAQVLPFRVLEAAEGKPLRIAGMLRNRNVYTPEELEAFAPKLVGSPIYLEHVAVPNAIGKVTNCAFDAQTKALRCEAEVYYWQFFKPKTWRQVATTSWVVAGRF